MNPFQQTIVKIMPKVESFFSLLEGCTKTEPKPQSVIVTCPWVNDDHTGSRYVPTCPSKVDHKGNQPKNSRNKKSHGVTERSEKPGFLMNLLSKCLDDGR